MSLILIVSMLYPFLLFYLLFLVIVTHSFDDGFYTSWKYGGSLFNYGMLSETQRLGCNFVKEHELSTDTFNVRSADYLLYPLITSDNHVMVLVHEIPVFRLYRYDQYLSLEAKYDIIDNIQYFIPSTEGPFSMYQEYNNRNYFVHQILHVDRSSTDEDQFVYLLIVAEIKDNNNANILWQFKYNRLYSKPGDYGTFYQHVVYKNYVFLQHATDSTGNNINRYVFDVNEGCILWNSSTSNKNDYHYTGPPIIFEDDEDDSILIVIDNMYNLYAIDMKTGDMKWESDMNAFSLLHRSSDRYMASIHQKYKLLFRGCRNGMGQSAICVFDVTNGQLLSINGYHEEHPKLRSFVLNNAQNTVIAITETAAIYYDIVVDTSFNITFIENQIIFKQYRQFYWMDNELNVMFSIDGYYGNNCSKTSSRESFIVSRSGAESQSVCIGLDGNYPVIPNKQTSNEQYVYFTSNQQLIAFKSPIRSTTTTTTNKPTYNPTVYEANMDYNSSKNMNSTNGSLPSYNHTQFVTTETTDFCLSTGSENISISNMKTTSISIGSQESEESFTAETVGIVVVAAIIPIICIMCYIRHRHRHRHRIGGQNAQIPNNVAANDESDFYPKKPPSSVQRTYNQNEMKMSVDKNAKQDIENEMNEEEQMDDIEMIEKQPTLSYSAVHCVICLDILLENESSKLLCGHRFHTHCIEEYNDTKQHCPLCRKPIVFD